MADNTDSVVFHGIPMDSNASGFLLNPSTFHSVYNQAKQDDGAIDLGLSLRTFQPEAYHPSGHSMPLRFSLHFLPFRPMHWETDAR